MSRPRRALVREVNPHLICVLCSGYFIEATTIIECLHSFCRSCLIKYLENSKFCPICDVQLHKNNPLLSVRCDPTLQQLVYKLIPGLYAKEMMRRRQYYAELGGPSSDPESVDQFPVGDAYFSPDDSISLSLEFLGGLKEDDTPTSDSDDQTLENQNFHHRRYLQCPAAVTMSHLQKFLRMKYGLGHDLKVDIIYEGEVLTEDFSLMDVAYTFNWKRATPMRFKFRLLQKNAVTLTVSAKETTTAVKDTPPSDKQTTTPPGGGTGGGVGSHAVKTEVDAKTLASKMKQPVVQVQKISTVQAVSHPTMESVQSPPPTVKVPKARKSFDKSMMKRSCPADLTSEPERKKMKILEPVKNDRKKNHNVQKVESSKLSKVYDIEDDDDDEEEEERNYMDDIIQEDDEMEDNDEEDRLRLSPSEENAKESKKSVESFKRELEIEPDVPNYRSEEKRREKKKSKKAKHHHHHRHHDRKRDSPPAATILHSPENDIMKLKIKLTDVNSKPKYSVVDGNEEKMNGHSPKYYEKYVEKEPKSKHKEEETKKVVNTNNNNNNNNNNNGSNNNNKAEPTKLKIDTSNKEKLSLMRNIRLKPSNVKSPPPLKDSPAHVSSPAESPKASPVHRTPASPKPVIPATAVKPTTPTMKPEAVKLPSSSITVSKITAAEKAQLDQQKLLMNRNGSNGLDSKRPSLEIMLVNAPKKSNDSSSSSVVEPAVKPVEVKKVMRPTPPSIPLSRLNKTMFGNKTSPPPLVLANSNKQSNNNTLDESGVLDLSGKSSRKSPDMELAMRNLVTLSDTASQVRNLMSSLEPLKIPIVPPNNNNNNNIKPTFQNLQRAVKPLPNQSVRQIPNPSALFRQHNGGGRSIPPPVIPINSLRKIESMTKNLGMSKNIDKVAAGLSLKASIEAGYAVK